MDCREAKLCASHNIQKTEEIWHGYVDIIDTGINALAQLGQTEAIFFIPFAYIKKIIDTYNSRGFKCVYNYNREILTIFWKNSEDRK